MGKLLPGIGRKDEMKRQSTEDFLGSAATIYNAVGLPYFWISHSWIQPTTDKNILRNYRDFFGTPVFKNLGARAGVMGSIPGPRRFYMLWSSLNSCATTTEPTCPRAHASQEKPLQREAHAPQ